MLIMVYSPFSIYPFPKISSNSFKNDTMSNPTENEAPANKRQGTVLCLLPVSFFLCAMFAVLFSDFCYEKSTQTMVGSPGLCAFFDPNLLNEKVARSTAGDFFEIKNHRRHLLKYYVVIISKNPFFVN